MHSTQVKSVTASASFDLAPLTTDPDSTTRLQGLKLDIAGSSHYYYFSFRRRTGYDNSLSTHLAPKVSVHRWSLSGNTRYDRSLDTGDVFDRWSSSGFKLSVLDNYGTGARIDVFMPGSAIARVWNNAGDHFWNRGANWDDIFVHGLILQIV